jgi:leader peptidase (prepilin peptidase)/N-methyltransferase
MPFDLIPLETWFEIWFGFVLVVVFLLGAAWGSFINVCIHRLPYEKSVLWPGSRCGHCLQPIRWYYNLPLISYWWLRGRCKVCGTRFSIRYFLVEFFTGLCFAGLFYLEVIQNVYDLDILRGHSLLYRALPMPVWALFFYHATLLCFLLAASFIDLEHLEIPLPLTITGTLVGLLGSVLWPWPWPNLPLQIAQAHPAASGGFWQFLPHIELPKLGLQPWPLWYPLPDWLPPGSWKTGLATSLAGVLAGVVMVRGIRFVFGLGRGKEGLGIGDADLMMMAGAFLGWQPVVMAFFISVFPALLMGAIQLVRRGNQEMPFGPALAMGILITMLGWQYIGPSVKLYFFSGPLFLIAVIGGGLVLFMASFFLRLVRRG